MKKTWLHSKCWLLLFICCLLLAGCHNNTQTQHEIHPSDESEQIPFAPVFLYQGTYYAVNTFSNTDVQKIPVDAVLFCIYEDMLLYIPQSTQDEPNGLWKANLDGSQPEKLTDMVSAWGSPVIIEGKVFSSCFGADGQIEPGVYSTDLKTKETDKIAEIPWIIYGYDDAHIYYQSSEERTAGIFRAAFDGREEEFLFAPGSREVYNIVVYDEKLYFSQKEDERYTIYCYDIEKAETVVVKQNIFDSRFDIAEGILYYPNEQEIIAHNLADGSEQVFENVNGERAGTARLLAVKDCVFWVV